MQAADLSRAVAPADAWADAMRSQDFARAWLISDRSLQEWLDHGPPKHHGPRHLQRIWDGQPLSGKRVLVRCYHGLGDTVQFIRFAAPLRRLASRLTVWAQPQLLPLIAGIEGVDEALPLHDGTPDVSFDADIEIMELPHALRADAAAIRRRAPYLHVPAASGPFATAGLAVGLVWQAGDWEPRRSLSADAMSPLANVPGVTLLSLQRGPAAKAHRCIPAIDVSSDDIVATARLLRSLDLVIAVDTFIAHLAGALGVRCWLMLHSDCDWRWGRSGRRTIWYPTMRLFRQPTEARWESVVEMVATELRSITNNSSPQEQTIIP